MLRPFAIAIVLALALALVPTLASAESSKLDPRARIALARLAQGSSIETMIEQGMPVTASGALDVFINGNVSRARLEALGVEVRTVLPGVMTATIPAGVVAQVEALPEVTGIHGAVVTEPELNASVPAMGVSVLRGVGPAFTGYNGQGVLVSDVDSGVDFRHGDFDDNSGATRLVNIWDQTVGGTPPAGYGYGTEWSPAQIDANTSTEIDQVGHGTHVLGIAGGDGSQTGGTVPAYTYAGVAPKADLLMVKTDFITTHIVDAVNYVFQKAASRAQNAVVNLSLGTHYGPHDGTSSFESALGALTGPGKIIVKSAGNERGQSRHDEVLAVTGPGTNATMTVSGSASSRMIGIDGYYESTDNIAVTIVTPNATTIGPIPLGGTNAAYPGQSTTSGTVYLENGVNLTSTNDREVYFEINVGAGQNMNGTWTFTFTAVSTGAGNGEVDLWRYVSSNGVTAPFVAGVQEEELVSEPGNAASLVCVAAWVTKPSWTACNGNTYAYASPPAVLNTLASFSSPGPTRDGRQKPDIAAPGQGIASTTGFDQLPTPACATGTSFLPDGMNHMINQGTSMAAPHVSGAVALLLQKFGAMTPTQVINYLTSHSLVDGNTGAVPNRDWGWGKAKVGDLTDPVVIVNSPNGGEVLTVGTPSSLTWSASDAVGGVTNVDVLLSRAGSGGTYEVLASAIANTGTYSWNPTGPGSTNAFLKVVAHDAAGNQGTDLSNAAFTVIDPTATLVALFNVAPTGDGVEVRWQLTDPSDYSRVAIERADDRRGPWAELSVAPHLEGDVAVIVDNDVQPDATYFYRIAATATDGHVQYFGPVSATAGHPITAFRLESVSPNPTTGVARIRFSLPTQAHVRLTIVDVTGREVARLTDGVEPAGAFEAVWSGERRGGRAEAGLYFARFESPAGSSVLRFVLAR